MGVEGQLLGPGVQDGEHADGAADVARVAGEFDDRLGGGLHQDGVAVALVGAQHLAEVFGHGDGDVEVAAGQHFGATSLQPLLGLVGMALGAAPVLARMV